MQRPALSAVAELLKPITWFPPMWAFACGAVSAGASPGAPNWGHLGLGVIILGIVSVSAWRAASIAAPSCLEANVYATASILWSDDALWHIGQSGWAGRLVRHDGEILTVGSWPREGA